MGEGRDEGLRDWELEWLSWARPIVRMAIDDEAHFEWCESALGRARYLPHPHDPAASDPTLRWPGYVGRKWKPGSGILFVGSVHSDFTKDGGRAGDPERRAIVQRLSEANARWREGVDPRPADDLHYLNETRDAYAALIPGWTRDGAFAEVRAAIGDAIDEVAWTNLAHCRSRPRTPGTDEYLLQRTCSGSAGAYPIGDLLSALRPLAVLACVAPLEGERHGRHFRFETSDGYRPILWCFRGDNGRRGGFRPNEWAPAFAQLIGDRRAERA